MADKRSFRPNKNSTADFSLRNIKKGKNKEKRMRYAKIHKKWTENYGMMNPNLNFLVQIVINKYRVGNERSATVSVYSNL